VIPFSAQQDGHGHVDVVVNCVWGGYESYNAADFDPKTLAWEQKMERFHKMVREFASCAVCFGRLGMGFRAGSCLVCVPGILS
jgi:hypothetical protein